MQIKRFEAKNMAEAFKNIKQEFGPDAVILSAKTIQKEKGLFNTVRPSRVEVLAANDTYILHQDNKVIPKQAIQKYVETIQPVESESVKPKNGMFQTISSRLNPLKSFKVTENNPLNESVEDLSELKKLKTQLQSQGIEDSIVSEIIDRVQRIKSSRKKSLSRDIRSLLIQALEEIGIESAANELEDKKKKTICLMGLTGVGKTTTLVKLAAVEILEKNRTVGVISLDSFRVGSNALLKVYASMLGFPVSCASDAKDVKAALKEYKDKDVILVDTPGIGLNDHYQKYQIKEMLSKIDPDETHLLMHANVKKADAKEITRQFELFDYNHILFTKIDETSTYGTIVNQLMDTEKSISYVTTGQNIPEDINKIVLNDLVNLLMKSQLNNEVRTADEGQAAKPVAPQGQFQRISFN